MHRRDPRQELDYGVHVSASIGQATSTEVEEHNRHVANQDRSCLVVRQSPAEKPKEDTSKIQQQQDRHVGKQVSGAIVLKSEAVEGANRDDCWVHPAEGQDLADHREVVRVDGVHVVGVLALENRVVVGYLQNLAEAAIDKLVRADQEGQANEVAVDLHVVLLVERLFVFTDLPEDRCLEEGLHNAQDEEEHDAHRLAPDVNHQALVQK